MFQAFNDRLASAFFKTILESKQLQLIIKIPSKIKRLSILAVIIDEKVSEKFEYKELLSKLVDESKEEFFTELKPNFGN